MRVGFASIFVAVITAAVVHLSDHASVDPDWDEPLDYSHNVFIPANAYKNYELFMEYAEVSGIGRSEITALPDISALPPSGDKDYTVGVNCILQLTTENDKRVLKKKSCTEGWTLKSALIQLFQNQNDITQQTGGLIHYENLRFSKLTFDPDGYIISGDSEGALYRHIQTKVQLSSDVQFEILIPQTYTFASSRMSLSGVQLVGEEGAEKRMNVNFNKEAGATTFKASFTIESTTLETFTKTFIDVDYLSGENVVDGAKLDTLKPLSVSTSNSGSSIKGIFNPEDGLFQLTLKSTSVSFAGQTVDIYVTIHRQSLGEKAQFAISVGHESTVTVNSIMGNYATTLEPFDNQLLTNILSKWYVTLASHDINIFDESSHRSMFADIFRGSTKFTFIKGIGLQMHVNLKKTLETCNSAKSVDASFGNLKISGQVSYGQAFKVSYPEHVKVPVESVVKCTDPTLATNLPSQIFALEQETAFDFEKISYDLDSGSVELGLGYSRPIVIAQDILVINNPKLEIKREKDEENVATWTYKIAADVTVFDMNASCSVEYSDSIITAEVTSTVIPISKLWQKFTGVEPSLNFEVHDFGMKVVVNLTKGSTNFELHITGKPVFNGYDDLRVETLVWKKEDNTYAVACAINFENVPLADVLENVLGVEEVPIAWLNNMTLVVAMSNTEASGCDNPAQSEDTCEESEEEEEESSDDGDSSAEADGTGASGGSKQKTKGMKKLKTRKSAEKKKLKKKRNKGKKTKSGSKQRYSRSLPANVKGKSKKKTLLRKKKTGKNIAAGKRDVTLTTLSELDIVRGLYVKATFFLPNDCKQDALCEWMKDKIPTTQLFIEGTFDASGVVLEAGIESEGIPIGDNLFLTKASLKLSLTTTEKSIELSCTLLYHNEDFSPDKLNFTGALSVSFSGKLEISMIMQGIIYQPFNIKTFAIGNLLLAVGITIAAGLPSLQIGCQIQIGNVKDVADQGGKFIFEGYLGVDPTDPNQNYFYARSSGDDLTLVNILKNFGISQDPQLPKPILESGFFGEIICSFASLGKEIPELGITVKTGFYFKGNLRILDLEVYTEICVSTDPESPSVYANITTTPINWVGGLLRIQRSRDDAQNGPYLVVNIDTSKVEVDLEGFASCLGISVGIEVHFNMSHSYFYIEGDLFSVLRANLSVAASYGSGSLADMYYQFESCLSFDLDRIAKFVHDAMKDAQRAVTQAMDKARSKVEAARTRALAALAKVRAWQNDITSYQNKLRARSTELERKKAELNYDCSTRCGKVCVGFLDWNSRCWKVWGRWCGCPKWNSCKWRVKDIICIAGCELKRAWNKFVAWAEQVGIQIMLGLTEVAKFLLNGVKIFEALVNAVLDFANGFLTVVEGFCNGVLDAVNAVVAALASVIKIEYFCVSGHLKPVESACLRCRAKMEIFEQPIEWDKQLCLDLSFFETVGKRTAVTYTPDIGLIEEKVQEFDSKSAKVEEDQRNMEKEESQQEKEVNKKTSDVPDINNRRRRRRTHVPTREEAYYYEQAYSHIPAPDIRNYRTEKSMYDGAPWLLTKSWEPAKRNMIPDESTAHKRILPLDTKDDCRRIENVYSNYGTIADGFNAFFQGLESQKAGFYSMKRSYIEGMNYIKNEFNYGDNKHNVTDEEREHIKYWHDYVINGLTQHITDTEKLMRSERKTYIPSFRESVNTIFGEQAKTSLSSYIDELHQAVTKTYNKRSDIPSPVIVEQTKKWNILRNAFKSIADDSSGTIREFATRLADANRVLLNLRRSEIPCAA